MDLLTGNKDWEYRADKRLAQKTPALSDGNLYVLSYDSEAADYYSLDAVDASTGSLKWRYRPGEPLSRAIAASNGSVYVLSDGGRFLYSLDAATGNLNWRGGYDIGCSQVEVADGVLYGVGINDELGSVFFAIRLSP